MSISTLVTCKKARILATLLVCAAAPASAITITPTNSRHETGGTRHYFQISDWSKYDVTPSPCGGGPISTICNVWISIKTEDLEIIDEYTFNLYPGSGVLTLGGMAIMLSTVGFHVPFSGSILVPWGKNGQCIELSSTANRTNNNREPLAPCAPLKPTPTNCQIDGATTIDHESLRDDALDGATASVKLNLKCTTSTIVTFTSSYDNLYGIKLRADDSLHSMITINGKSAHNTGINIPTFSNQATTLNITSTLYSRGEVAPGPFSGSTVITATWP